MNSKSLDLEGDRVVAGSRELTLGAEVGSGNEGVVYRVDGAPERVVKVFFEDRRDEKEAKVRAMIDNEPTDATDDPDDVPPIIWPEVPVEHAADGSFLGYEMPYKDIEDATPAFEYSVVTLDWSDSEPHDRFKAARNLSIVVHNVHQAGHALGDFNDKNILLDDGHVTLIDCDAFHVSDQDTIYADKSYHPRYSPPERRGRSLTAVQKADRFCLGVHIFQFLMEGQHPYHGIGDDVVDGDWPEKIKGNPFPYGTPDADVRPEDRHRQRYQQLPAKIHGLFEQCFAQGAKSHTWGRPKPIEWVKVFGELTDYSQQVTFEESSAQGSDGAGTAGEPTVPEFGSPSPDQTTGSGAGDSEGESVTVPDFGGHEGHSEAGGPDGGSDEEPTVPDFGA